MHISKKDIEILFLPTVSLVVILILSAVAVSIIYNNTTRLSRDLSTTQSAEKTLQEKENTLKTVTAEIPQESQLALGALPSTQSVIPEVSQIKLFASGLAISNISFNGSPSSGKDVNPVPIDFTAEGSYGDILNFVTRLQNSIPVNNFSSITINKEQAASDIYRLTAQITSYWSPLPTQIPAVEDPVVMLDESEQEIMNKLTLLESPATNSSSGNSTTGVVVGKTNPFQ